MAAVDVVDSSAGMRKDEKQNVGQERMRQVNTWIRNSPFPTPDCPKSLERTQECH